MRSGEIEILWNGAPLEFKEPPILEEELPNGQKVIWKKRIKIENTNLMVKILLIILLADKSSSAEDTSLSNVI